MAACPYHAIVKTIVPCEEVCPVGAIAKGDDGLAHIDKDKCLSCGKCVSACPFGATHAKSQVIDVLSKIKQGKEVIAMFAPAVVGHLPCSAEQFIEAFKKIGFSEVYEVAQGADTTIQVEAHDFAERLEQGAPFMTTSCCAAYNELVKKHLPEIKPYVSDAHTPLYYTAEIVKKELEDLNLVEKGIIKVIPNAVDTDIFCPQDKKTCRKSLSLPEDEFIIGFVGSFSHRKGDQRILEAINGFNDVKAIFAGNGTKNVRFTLY